MKKNRKIFGFTLSEMLIAMAVVSIIATIIAPILKSAIPSTNRVMLRKAYSTTEKTVFRILSMRNSSKTLIFSLDNAFMDTTTNISDIGGKNKFCYYFKEQLNTLDVSGVDCPAASVTAITPVRFAKTTDGIDWYISPVAFSNIDIDKVVQLTNTQMETYANQKAQAAVNANASKTEAEAKKAYERAYDEAWNNPTEVVSEDTTVNVKSCSLNDHCNCDESQTKYVYYIITNNNGVLSYTTTNRDGAVDVLKTNYFGRIDLEVACGSTNYCLVYNSLEGLNLDYNYNAFKFANNITIVVVPNEKTYTFSYDYSLEGAAYPQKVKSGERIILTKVFTPYEIDDAEYKSCPPCKEINAAGEARDGSFAELSLVKASLNRFIGELQDTIEDYMNNLKVQNDKERDTAAKAYANQKYQETKASLEHEYWTDAYDSAKNDRTVYDTYYNNNLKSASGTGNAKLDFPLKIIVDVNGVSNPPNCSADSSAYGASYMPAGYKNTTCSEPDTFIFGIRYDGKIRIANSASSYSVTAFTDSVAKEYLSNFIHH